MFQMEQKCSRPKLVQIEQKEKKSLFCVFTAICILYEKVYMCVGPRNLNFLSGGNIWSTLKVGMKIEKKIYIPDQNIAADSEGQKPLRPIMPKAN